MSVIFHAHGHVVYESPQALDTVVSTIRRKKGLNGDLQWTNGAGEQFRSSNETALHRDWNGLELPYATMYRDLEIQELLQGVYWARICMSAFTDSPETHVYDENGVRETVYLDEWAQNELGYDEGTYEVRNVAREYHDQLDTEPPQSVKEDVQYSPPGRQAELIEFAA